MNEKKSLLLALLYVLSEYSDENNLLSREEILTHLEKKFDICIERRTLYSSIDSLKGLGYDISDFKDNKKGYYLRERRLEYSEINLLCHVIYSSHIIPTKYSNELIDKLLKTQSKYQRNEIKRAFHGKNSKKNENPQFFLNIEQILEAIRKRKEVHFTYVKQQSEKLQINLMKEHTLAPYHVVYENGSYYLLGKKEDKPDISHFRIDKIRNIVLTETTFLVEHNFNPYHYIKSKTYMYSGDIISVLLRCDNSIINHVQDHFGQDVQIQKEDNDTFVIRVSSSEQGILYWILQFIEYCTIIEPLSLREKLKNVLKTALNKLE